MNVLDIGTGTGLLSMMAAKLGADSIYACEVRIYLCFEMSPNECRTKHPRTKHPMPFFATPDKTSLINLPPRTKHPMQFLSPRTKHPMPFLPPRTKHPMLLLPPRTKHPTLCLKPMKVHKTSHLVNCHYYY